jgi:hypothetical protein
MQMKCRKKGGEIENLENMVDACESAAQGMRKKTNLHVADGRTGRL